ncbi:hypothetical protein PAERUG_P2_London_28_IMP_1_06_05_03940 [Pseudomonas aeruginosa]|nr:hypothetical protein PAERUG_P2_London_28_IMP_1_06_05_03940 [Pseudomonas aeruginosa]CRX13825.1 hypothetical protein PAERUG_P9_East_of_England_6_IMP_13_08_09_05651 [Pseudomonas aeruginosa]
MPREPAARVPWRWMMAIGELLASSRRSSSSVLRLRISWSSVSLSWFTAATASWFAATLGSFLPVSSVRWSSNAFSNTDDSATSDARRRASSSLSGSSRSASITPRVMGSEVLPAARKCSNVVLRVPETSSCRASSFSSYSSWISGVSPTPGTVSVLVQASQVRCTCSPSTRVAHSVACCGDVQVWQDRLAQLVGAMEDVSVTPRPLTRL